MRNALYYPHADIADTSILRTALLLWDELELVAPWDGWCSRHADPLIAEAQDLVVRPRVPSDHVKAEAHREIVRLLEDGFADRIRLVPSFPDQSLVHARKLSYETWALLADAGLADEVNDGAAYRVSEAASLILLSVIADVRAGDQFARVTDREDAYRIIANTISRPLEVEDPTPDDSLIVALPAKIFDARSIPLPRLVDLRRREAQAGGHFLRGLRHRLSEHVTAQFAELSSAPADYHADITREFDRRLKDLESELREALRLNLHRAIFSTEVVALCVFGGAIASRGSAAEALAVSAVGAFIGGARVLDRFTAGRREIMRANPAAYLYQLEGKGRLRS